MERIRAVYLNMYWSIDLAYDMDKNEELDLFLSDANPSILDGYMPGDPAVWAEFQKDFQEQYPSGEASNEASYDFVYKYLSNEYPYVAKVFRETATKKAWAKHFDKLKDNE